MSVPVIAFFNNKGGVGKTTMVYHLAWMLADSGVRAIAADLDPQCNLTAAFLDEDRIEEVMAKGERALTVFSAVRDLKRGTGDVKEPHVENIANRLGLIAGDMGLSTFEDQLSENWPKCLDGDERAFRVTSAFYRVVQLAGAKQESDVIVVDLGPNLGAINRAALIASDFVVIPLGPDLFSLQGLENLGPALRRWRKAWKERIKKKPAGADIDLPKGSIQPIGYVLLRHSIRLDRPVKAFERWAARVPGTYAEAVLDTIVDASVSIDTDPACIAKLRDYRSLMPLAQEARKPMFFLKPADGALGSHANAAAQAYKDFKDVARKIAAAAGIPNFE
ncbi:MAG: AAA family ATPase [Planctomycetes bacterium]|nr:AAA family ATPase [Planctomycetota bacterium]